MARRQSLHFMSNPSERNPTMTLTPPQSTTAGTSFNNTPFRQHKPSPIDSKQQRSRHIRRTGRQFPSYNNNSHRPDDTDADSEDSDEYDETMFSKYQQSINGVGASQSVRGSAMGQGGATSRRSTTGTWRLGRQSNGSDTTGGADRRMSKATTLTGTNNRRASFVANMSLVPIAIARLKTMENESGTLEMHRSRNLLGSIDQELGNTSEGNLVEDGQGRRMSKATGGMRRWDLDEITLALKRTEAIAERRTSAIAQMKAEVLLYIARLIFGVSMLLVVIIDFVYILYLEQVPITAHWLFSLELINVWGVYLFILPINVAAFLLRCSLVFLYWDLVPDNVESNFFRDDEVVFVDTA
ncbi:hypothetical protein BC829DRAFT_387036 [Chytridium lagenaria]|nr:hypothetical protein BC829DRAFT_387036 [Chytridium lagenaria]